MKLNAGSATTILNLKHSKGVITNEHKHTT